MRVLQVFSILVLVVCFYFLTSSGAVLAEEELYFTILHTNDEHSSLFPRNPAADYHPIERDPTTGGMARLAGLIGEIREEKDEPVLLLSGGDFLGGAPYAWLSLREMSPEIKLMQRIGYDAVVIGNHEFDYGPESLAEYLKRADYPQAHSRTVLLGTNIEPPADHPLKDIDIKNYHIIELENGLKVGLFGLIGKDAISVAIRTDPINFLDQHEAAREAVARLKEKGAQVIVAVTHSGVGEDRDLAKDVEGIDVIVGGHCHTALHEPIIEGDTIIVQAGSLLRHLGVLELAYDTQEQVVRVVNKYPSLIPIDDSIDECPFIKREVDGYTDTLNLMMEYLTGGEFDNILNVVVVSDFIVSRTPPLEETPFGNFITDAMRLVAQEQLGEPVDFAFQANGQIRGSIIPGSMEYSKGHVTLYDLAELCSLGEGYDGNPGYPLVSIYLTGEEVRRVLEVSAFLSQYMGNTYFLQVSGLRYEYDPDRAILLNVPIMNVPVPTARAVTAAWKYTGEGYQDFDGAYQPLDRGDEELYHVVTDYYLLGFLPLVGELVPQLTLVPKDKEGQPLKNLKDAIIYDEQGELKVWQALIKYAAAQPEGSDGLPVIPQYYEDTSRRIEEVWTFPFLLYPVLLIVLLILIINFFVNRRRRVNKSAS